MTDARPIIDPPCRHAAAVTEPPTPHTIQGCEECLKTGGRWVHLRICAECGHVGCCDSSPSRHASAHHRETGHAIVVSFEPGERWGWCYADEVDFELSYEPYRRAHAAVR
jgi:monovalent cation/hydrogen antiporter